MKWMSERERGGQGTGDRVKGMYLHQLRNERHTLRQQRKEGFSKSVIDCHDSAEGAEPLHGIIRASDGEELIVERFPKDFSVCGNGELSL